jgi:hypothetical protein
VRSWHILLLSRSVNTVEVGLHTVVLDKVISYLILYNKSTFPGYFTCGLVYNGHLAGTG